MNIDEARNFSRLLNLPPLTGTLAAIQEAEQIRAEKLKRVPWFEENWEVYLRELKTRSLHEYSLENLKLADLSGFWIENRHLDFWELLEWFD
ncbi:hypothetical protein NDI44_27385 [Trichocoleus sp. DQ-A3]|uniref:hypothetical protein n=1 Tax=Cyanophyceae TaxID=3028117 RepID=UPI0016887CC3|nr:hypothetical protein [Coleofasciculus sp. FACHB-125]MBD1903715.1 hypothetical protein [Coleofasciculus sp. FACHB-125]